MEKIATIMSVYRGDNPVDFRAAIESVLNQEFDRPIDSRVYLAVDGPISDLLAREVSAIESRLHCTIRIEKNGGLANALNNLIGLLEEERFVFRMDSDDQSEPNRYQAQLDYFSRRPEIDILGTDIVEVHCDPRKNRLVRFSRNPQEARDRLYWRVPVAHPTVCFRRQVLDAVGGYPDVPSNEDIALWFRCAELGFSFDNVPEPLYKFKIDDQFWKRRSIKKAFGEWRCYISGGIRVNGASWKLILPTGRLALRLLPRWMQKRAYASTFLRR